MTTYTAKTADADQAAKSIYDNINTTAGATEAARVRKLAAKLEVSFEEALTAMLVKKIRYGAIRISGRWYPVVSGEIIPNGHTFSTGAMSQTVRLADVALKID